MNTDMELSSWHRNMHTLSEYELLRFLGTLSFDEFHKQINVLHSIAVGIYYNQSDNSQKSTVIVPTVYRSLIAASSARMADKFVGLSHFVSDVEKDFLRYKRDIERITSESFKQPLNSHIRNGSLLHVQQF